MWLIQAADTAAAGNGVSFSLIETVLGLLLTMALGAMAAAWKQQSQNKIDTAKIYEDAVERARVSSLETLQAALAEQRKQTEFFKGEADAYRSQLDRQKQEVDALRERIVSLEKEIASLEKDLRGSKARPKP